MMLVIILRNQRKLIPDKIDSLDVVYIYITITFDGYLGKNNCGYLVKCNHMHPPLTI